MSRKDFEDNNLGARARSVMEVIYRLGEVSGPDILRELPDLPSYSAVRSILRSLEAKGLVEHRAQGLRYVYRATVPKEEASRTALQRVLDTYFGGFPEHAAQALLDLSRDRNQSFDHAKFTRLIDDARREGR
jgi:predicted transcriptional regulator